MQSTFTKTKAIGGSYSDEELVSLFVETQNDFYFGLLYERYAGNVQRRCMHVIKDVARAEDLTQDIFLKLISRLASFRNHCRFESWLNIVAYNFCLDEMRSHKRRREIAMEYGLQFENDEPVQNEHDEVDHLKKTVIFLTLDEQNLLRMRYNHNLSIREIAEHLKISESAIKMRLLRTKARVRKNFNRQAFERH